MTKRRPYFAPVSLFVLASAALFAASAAAKRVDRAKLSIADFIGHQLARILALATPQPSAEEIAALNLAATLSALEAVRAGHMPGPLGDDIARAGAAGDDVDALLAAAVLDLRVRLKRYHANANDDSNKLDDLAGELARLLRYTRSRDPGFDAFERPPTPPDATPGGAAVAVPRANLRSVGGCSVPDCVECARADGGDVLRAEGEGLPPRERTVDRSFEQHEETLAGTASAR